MRFSLLLFCLFFIQCYACGQQFGGTPPSVKWRQIDTDTARIIFPQGLDSQASRVATLMHLQAANNRMPLGKRLKKIQVVLQNQTVIPNGYVGLGPYRSELYLTPPTETFSQGTIPWTDQLALHEYRHVQQFNNFHNGLSKLMATLFGQEGYALAVNASIPDWFYEGDAVYTETVLTRQGRGRLPLFQNAYPALWAGGKRYSWMKLRNGSLKDYVPGHYDLGYLLVSYGYGKYGDDFWQKVTHDASAFKGLFYPFQKAVQKHTGISYRAFRESALAWYRQKADSAGHRKEIPVQVQNITPGNQRVVENYLFPYAIGQDSVLALKTSYNRRPVFIIKNKDREHRIRVRDIAVDDQYSYRNGKIVYAAYENDARWRWRNYSVLKLLDIATGKQVRLTKKTKYFTPDIDASGRYVVAAEQAANGTSSLHLLNVATGEVEKKIPAWGGHVFTDPKFLNTDTVVVVVRLPDGKSVLGLADWVSGSIIRLTPPSYQVAGNPSVVRDAVYFTASYEGLDHVYVLKLKEKKIYRLTNGSLGEYFVNAGDEKITWSAFTADGYQLQQADKEALLRQADPVQVQEEVLPLFAIQSGGTPALLPVPLRQFDSRPYLKSKNLINFHSWRPYYEDPLFYFSLYGENILNTLQTEIYYQYNENDKTNAVGAGIVFGQWFPHLQAGVEYTFDRQVQAGNKLKQWSQLDSRIGFSIPLSRVKGRTVNYFTAGTNYHYRSDFNKGIYKDSFATIQFGYLHHYIQWGSQVEMARQHIYPRLGYNLLVQHRYITNRYKSWQVHTAGALYLPGALPAHSLVLTGAYLETDTVNAAFGNSFAYPRGYNALYFPTVASMWRTSANYHFPLLYPDRGFANILYIQRVRGNVFFDYGKVFSKDKRSSASQRTVGGEFYFDTKWWNQYALTFGFRISHLLDRDYYTGQTGATVFELIMPVSIIPR